VNGLLIAVGGAIGSLSRYWVAEWVARLLGTAFPYGTLLVNVTGSVLIGLAAGGSWDHVRLSEAPVVRSFVMVGICGGYTTFSSFSLQTLLLLQAGEWLRASVNVLLSVFACLLASWAGFALATFFSR
jgi:fluoride exporter